MKQHWLNEDKLPSRLFVAFSSEIRKRIDTIDAYNQDNPEGLSQWQDYLNGIKRYISNPVIAWDNTNRYSRLPNGTRFIRDFGFNVGFSVKTNKTTNKPYVYIFMVNLNPEEFGLKVPTSTNEAKQRIESIRKAVMPILEFNQRLSAIR